MRTSLLITFMILSGSGTAEDTTFAQVVRPFLVKYCTDCHDADTKKGKRDFDQFKTETDVARDLIAWERAEHRIKNQEMPPEKKKEKPTEDERKAVVEWWQKYRAKADCEQLAFDSNTNFYRGYVFSRRLNRTEYRRSVFDLTGVHFDAKSFFPKDGAGGEGFDNQGAALFLSPIHMEKYLDAAERIMNQAIWTPERAELEGTPVPDSPVHRRIFDQPALEDVSNHQVASKIIRSFARRAFRRTPSAEQMEKLMRLYDASVARKSSHEFSIKLALTSVLMSPRFLYLPEREQDVAGHYRLHSLEVASRLSYFLWSTVPDDQLLTLAEDGELDKDDVLIAQAIRMIRDRKIGGLAEDFSTQWLGIRDLGENIRPDPKRYPEFDAKLNDAMRRETVLLATEIFREDRSLLEFIQTDFTWLNEQLAEHYGIANIKGEHFRRVSLSDNRRGGLLGMGSVLTATSYPLRTSPVLRGKWVLETVFGSRVNPPPPDAGELPADDSNEKGMTFREQLELHRTKPECASCHNRMDPIGFGLENFDAIGRWRDTQNGKPIDASGKFGNGQTFKGPEEMKKILLQRRDQFVNHITKKMFSYALGRGLNRYDHCYVRKAVEELKKTDYRSSVLIHNIVTSLPFLHRQNR